MKIISIASSSLLLGMTVAAIFGCSGPTVYSAKLNMHAAGIARGGQQPVSGALIQLYSVGTLGDGSSATPLIGAVITTSDGSGNAQNSNANPGNNYNSLPLGAFTITGDYTCPSPTAEMYLVGTGGNPGLGGAQSNPNLALMAGLGQCGSLNSSSYVVVNELTTVASIEALASFMTSYGSIGSADADRGDLVAAFANINALSDISKGSIPGPTLPVGFSAPLQEMNTLGDILASCVNSSGGIAGDGSNCGKLFALATPWRGTPPTNTIQAALDLILYAPQNGSEVLTLVAPNPPFLPTMMDVPTNWTVALTPIASTQPPPVQWPAMYGLDLWLPFTDQTGPTVRDATGKGHDGTIGGSGTPAIWAGTVGLILNAQTVNIPNASGRSTFGMCAYFPAGGMPYNGGYFYGLADYFPGGGENGLNLSTSYGPGNLIFHGADAYFPQIGASNGAPVTYSADGFSGNHCVEGIPGGTLDHIIVDGREVTYGAHGTSSSSVGGPEVSSPMYVSGGNGTQSGLPVTVYSVWAATNTDSVEQAEARTLSEISRLQTLGVPFAIVSPKSTGSTCSIDGTSIDLGFQAGNVRTGSVLNLDFPCTINDFSESGQPPMDMNAGFDDRAGRVFHPNGARNIAYTGGAVNGIIAYSEPPPLALRDILNWNAKAHALGYKTIVSTMMSACATGYGGESGDTLAQQFNALLLGEGDQFDWVDNLAAWPLLGATAACAGQAFADGLHLTSGVGQPLYVANERAGFEGVYGNSTTVINGGDYNQLPSDRSIQITGTASSVITLIDANSASFNFAGKLCVHNTSAAGALLVPVAGELIDALPMFPLISGSSVCVKPVVKNIANAGANWTLQ